MVRSFRIVDKPKNWPKQRRDRLKGLSAKHKAMVKRLQPFEGCKWTRYLRELSNPDKHRQLTATRGRMKTVVYSNTSATSDTIHPPTQKTTNMQSQPTLEMLFNDEYPVIETLKELKDQVTIVLGSFNPDF